MSVFQGERIKNVERVGCWTNPAITDLIRKDSLECVTTLCRCENCRVAPGVQFVELMHTG